MYTRTYTHTHTHTHTHTLGVVGIVDVKINKCEVKREHIERLFHIEERLFHIETLFRRRSLFCTGQTSIVETLFQRRTLLLPQNKSHLFHCIHENIVPHGNIVPQKNTIITPKATHSIAYT